MTAAVNAYPLIGQAPIGNVFVPDVFSTSPTDLIGTFQKHPLGTVVSVVDPWWGGQEYIYGRVAASQTVRVGSVVAMDSSGGTTANNQLSYPTMTLAASTANLGQPIAVAINAVTTGANQSAVGWFGIRGRFPLYSSASVAANALIAVAATGQGGAIANGKEIVNARVIQAATATIAKTCSTVAGSNIIRPLNGIADGWFVGLVLTSTSWSGNAFISSIAADGSMTLVTAFGGSTATTVTATASVTVTGTFNDGTNFWNVVDIDRPFMQGQIV